MTLNALQTDEVQQKLLDAGFTEEEIQQLSVSPAAAGGGRVQFGLDEQPRVKANFLVGSILKTAWDCNWTSVSFYPSAKKWQRAKPLL